LETRSVRPKRSVQHAQAAAARPRAARSLLHHTRLERERRRRLWVLAAGIAVILIVLAIPAFGYYREVIRVGDTQALSVDGQSISLEQYARYAGAWQAILSRQIVRERALAPPPSTTPVPNLTPQQQQAQRNLQSLESEQSQVSTSALSQLLEARLVLDEGKTRGLTVTPAELDNARRWLVSTPQTATNPGSGLAAAPDSLPITGTVSIADSQADFAKIGADPKLLTSDQIDEFIVKPAVLKAKLVAALAGPVQTTGPQIHARHILVATLEQAQTVKKDLDSGVSFADEAKKYSTDTSNKDNAGDLGWFGKGVMVPEFEQAAFALKVGEISQPVKSSFGYHIIQVLESDPNRPLDAARIQQLREQGYQTWLSKAQSDPQKVSYGPASSKSDWVRTYIGTPPS
jgi:parvulin-like peptidyl-prolyl isomerase